MLETGQRRKCSIRSLTAGILVWSGLWGHLVASSVPTVVASTLNRCSMLHHALWSLSALELCSKDKLKACHQRSLYRFSIQILASNRALIWTHHICNVALNDSPWSVDHIIITCHTLWSSMPKCALNVIKRSEADVVFCMFDLCGGVGSTAGGSAGLALAAESPQAFLAVVYGSPLHSLSPQYCYDQYKTLATAVFFLFKT